MDSFVSTLSFAKQTDFVDFEESKSVEMEYSILCAIFSSSACSLIEIGRFRSCLLCVEYTLAIVRSRPVAYQVKTD